MKLMEGDSKALQKHKEELFGTEKEYQYPDLYSMVNLGKELVGSYPQFLEMMQDPKQVRTVAKMIAQYRLEKMLELIQRHESLVKRNQEKQTKGKGKK